MYDKERFQAISCLFLAIFLSLAAISALSLNFAEGAEGIGKFSSIEGSVDSLRDGKLPAVPAKVGDLVFERDVIRTRSASRAEIGFKDGNTLRIAQRSRINISEYMTSEHSSREIIQLQRGKVEAIVDKNNAKRISLSKDAHFFEIRTPNAVAGVRGTDFFVSSDMNVTVVLVKKEGNVCVYNTNNPEKVVCLPPDYITTVTGENPPAAMRPATDTDFKWFETDIGSEFNPSPLGGTNTNIGGIEPTDVITTDTPHTMRDVPLSIPYSVTNPQTLTPPTPTPPTPTPPTPTPPTPTPPTPTPPTPPTPTPPTPTPPTPTPPTPMPPTPTPPIPTPPTPTPPGGGGDLTPLNPPKPPHETTLPHVGDLPSNR
ncbi:MAG: FecR domain-containing protein [Dissulfurispiraceae bacterium]